MPEVPSIASVSEDVVVEKHQHSDGWVPVVTAKGKIGLAHASPSEYLRRLDLQNELFGDDIQVIGITRSNRFAITQPALKGGGANRDRNP